MYILSTAASGARCPRICGPEAPCMITSACGTGTARWIASIMGSTSSAREKARARSSSPTACDSQSVKSDEKGGLASCHAFDAGKLIKGRHVLVDTQGLLLHGIVTAVRGSRSAVSRCGRPCGLFPFSRVNCSPMAPIRPVHRAPAGILPDRETEIVKRSDRVKGFVPAQALGGRTHHRLAQPLPPTGQGLGEPRRNASPSSSSRPSRLDAPKTL